MWIWNARNIMLVFFFPHICQLDVGYGVFYEPIWKGKLEINVSYCDSKHNYLIQASDILANRLWTSFKIDNREMRNIPEHSCMRLP